MSYDDYAIVKGFYNIVVNGKVVAREKVLSSADPIDQSHECSEDCSCCDTDDSQENFVNQKNKSNDSKVEDTSIEEPLISWREMIEEEREQYGDGPIVSCTLKDDELDMKFDFGRGLIEGKPFTAWSDNRVYFSTVYDGPKWVDIVQRNPCDE